MSLSPLRANTDLSVIAQRILASSATEQECIARIWKAIGMDDVFNRVLNENLSVLSQTPHIRTLALALEYVSRFYPYIEPDRLDTIAFTLSSLPVRFFRKPSQIPDASAYLFFLSLKRSSPGWPIAKVHGTTLPMVSTTSCIVWVLSSILVPEDGVSLPTILATLSSDIKILRIIVHCIGHH